MNAKNPVNIVVKFTMSETMAQFSDVKNQIKEKDR